LIPIRFGAENRQLFGLYQAALKDNSRNECIVLCNPFGQEAIRSHRLFKVLADRLCRDGFHVLRFDYFGTGDSAGDGDEVSIRGLVDDLFTADNEVVQRSGCTRRSWIGLRLGATIAALASTKVSVSPHRLILWEPVIDGANYLIELAHAHTLALEDAYGSRCAYDLALRDKFGRESGQEALGFPIVDSFRAELNSLTLNSLSGVQASAIDIFSNAISAAKIADNTVQVEWAKRLGARGIEVFSASIEEPIIWTADEMMNAATVPGEVLQRISARFANNPTHGLTPVAP
jgi:uncharacterized protein